MHKTIFICTVFLFLLVVSCKSQGNKTEKQEIQTTSSGASAVAQVEVKEGSFDFGKLKGGEIVTHTFQIKNTGTGNLLIRNIDTSCGCTTPSYSKKPIKPGETGKIEITFDTKGRSGKQYKVIQVFANIPERSFQLTFKADIH